MATIRVNVLKDQNAARSLGLHISRKTKMLVRHRRPTVWARAINRDDRLCQVRWQRSETLKSCNRQVSEALRRR